MLSSTMCQEELNRSWKMQAMMRWARYAKNPVIPFPIKKRINTELFIDRKQGLYVQKGGKEMD